MAKITTVQTVDDIDGSDNAATISFGLEGVSYEIDLGEKNAAALRDALATYIAHGTRVGGRKVRASRGASGDRSRIAAMREWLRDNGYEVSDRGRLPANLVAAYEAAH